MTKKIGCHIGKNKERLTKEKKMMKRYDIIPITQFITVLYYIVKCLPRFSRLDNSQFIFPSNGTKKYIPVL